MLEKSALNVSPRAKIQILSSMSTGLITCHRLQWIKDRKHVDLWWDP